MATEVIAALGFLVAVVCFRQAGWHMRESEFWADVAHEVAMDPQRDEFYRPILRWSQAHQPAFWQRLAPWRSPLRRWEEAVNG